MLWGRRVMKEKKATLLSHVSLPTWVAFGYAEPHIQLATYALQPDKFWSSCLSTGARFTCTDELPFWVKGTRKAYNSFLSQHR